MSKKRGPHTIHKLSSAKVKQADKGMYADGGGLWLTKDSLKTGRWTFRYRFRHRAHEMGLGSIHTTSLSEAREAARHLRRLAKKGIDPLAQKRADEAKAKMEEAAAVTFEAYAKEYIRDNGARWSNAKHAAQWTSTLAAYVYPLIGDLPIAAVDREAVERVLRQPVDGVQFWRARPETANRVRARIAKILTAATADGKRVGDNPAKWDNLEHRFPSRRHTEKGEAKHHRSLPFSQVPDFMAKLRGGDGVDARLLEFIVLTCARFQEAQGLRWEEIDLPNRVWVCPAQRMKAKREHRAPLSPRAVKILEELRPDSAGAYVFPAEAADLSPIGQSGRCSPSWATP